MKKTTNENVVVILAVASVLAIAFGLLLPTLGFLYHKPILDHIAVYFWALWVVPLMSLQFFIPAGIYVSFISELSTLVKLLIYFVVLPAANVWFFFWMGAIYDFLPAHESINDVLKLLLFYSTILSTSLTVIGFAVRFFRLKKKSL
jgi:hypothetical protein